VTRVFTGSTPRLAVNFAGETAGVVGLSYIFHKTGHHKLERAVSMLNMSASGAAVTYDLAHR
jgi:kynureninase